jgi:hypothetical protein
MTLNTHAGMTGTAATPAEVGAKHIRWGLGLFVFDQVHQAFLKNVTKDACPRWRPDC